MKICFRRAALLLMAALFLGVIFIALRKYFSGSVTNQENTNSSLRPQETSNALATERLSSAVGRLGESNENSLAGEENKLLCRQLDEARVELEKLSRPLRVDIASSTVSATINDGESLITGGYRTADGNYELTFFTPKNVKLKDGRNAIEIDAKIVSMPAEMMAANGLENMATNARNTLQHAEAWQREDVESTLAGMDWKESGGICASPKITTLSSELFSIGVGSETGAEYTLEGNVIRKANGSFAIKTRVERNENAYPPPDRTSGNN